MRRSAGWAASQLLPRSTAASPLSTYPHCTAGFAEHCWQTSSIGTAARNCSLHLRDFSGTATAATAHSLQGVSSRSIAAYLPCSGRGFTLPAFNGSSLPCPIPGSLSLAGARKASGCVNISRGFASASIGSRTVSATQRSGPAREAALVQQAVANGVARVQSAGGHWRGFAADAGTAKANPAVRRRAMMAAAEQKSSGQALYLVSAPHHHQHPDPIAKPYNDFFGALSVYNIVTMGTSNGW